MRRAYIQSILIAALIFTALSFATASSAWAHAFGIRYDLPLPLWFYLSGAGAAVALSFAVMALFLKDYGASIAEFRFDLLALRPFRWLSDARTLNSIRAVSLAVFVTLLAAGFFGNQDPFKNIEPTFIWVIWWVGMAFISSLAGNLWDLLNPWKIAFVWAMKVRGGRIRPHPYPSWLGRWPAVLFFMIFAWMELISEQSEQPRVLATLIILYSGITWAGMKYFGQETWLKHGEIFTAVFSLLARFALCHGEKGRWWIRLPAVGLLSHRPVHISGLCFVLLFLTSVTFDGILETPSWTAVLTWIAENQTLRPLLLSLQDAGVDLISLIKTIALIILPVLFIGAFFMTSKAIAWTGGGAVQTIEVAGYFVLSLVPIAIAYHLSHYLSYLLIAGQNLIPLISDPFGRGWDLFGTSAYTIDIGVVNAKMIWYFSVTTIVIGHVLAVFIAHVMAIRIFTDRGHALRSQIPMLILMVGYTMISLWILSQPIIT